MDYVAVMIVSLVIGLVLRAGIAGEIFDSALHQVDPSYRNIRDIGRQLIRHPGEGLRRLPASYGRYYGYYFRAVDDPSVDGLRRHAIRALFEVLIFGFSALFVVLVARRPLEHLGLLQGATIAWNGTLLLYWLRRLLRATSDPRPPPLARAFALLGAATSLTGIVATALLSTRT